MDKGGAWFVSIVDLTHGVDDTNSHMFDIPLQLPASAHILSRILTRVTFSEAGSDPVQNVHSQPIPKQTRVNLWQLQSPVAYRQSVLAVLGPQEAVQLVTQREREALNDQRETARRALLLQQGEFLAATHQHEVAARENLVNAVTRNNEAHNYNVQMQVRQLEHEADARFPRDKGNCYLDFLSKQIKLLKVSEKF